MTEHSTMLDKLQQQWDAVAAADADGAHEIYVDDAVLEFPQSGERFEGVENFKTWRSQYPAQVRFRVRRTTVRADFAVQETSVSYDGGPWQLGVRLLDLHDEKIVRERIYVTEPWEAPDWRAEWRAATPADQPAT